MPNDYEDGTNNGGNEEGFEIIENPNMRDILNISVNQSITIKNNSTTIQTLTTILQEQLAATSSSPAVAAPPPPSNLTYGSLSDSMSSLGSLISLSSSDTSVLLDPLVSPVPPVPPVPSVLPFICTSEGTPLSTRTNWIAPISSYKEPCHLCEYFGHGLNTCPNLHPDFSGKCCKCWSNPSRECRISGRKCIRKPIPFKNNFLKPTDLLKFYGRIEE